jgi:hypothetical protein
VDDRSSGGLDDTGRWPGRYGPSPESLQLSLGTKPKEEAMGYEPRQYEAVERDELEARLRLAEARDKAEMSDGEAATADHELIQRLEADWKHALELLHHHPDHKDR